MRQTLAIIGAILLPSLAFGAGAIGIAVLTDVTPPFMPAAEALGGKSLGYWFVSLACVSVGSWTWIVKWLIKLNETQRAAHERQTAELISYLKSDHASTSAILQQTNDLMKSVVDHLAHTPSRR